jgi:hypothetical protein
MPQSSAGIPARSYPGMLARAMTQVAGIADSFFMPLLSPPRADAHALRVLLSSRGGLGRQLGWTVRATTATPYGRREGADRRHKLAEHMPANAWTLEAFNTGYRC